MKQNLKIIGIVTITAIITAAITSYSVKKNTAINFINEFSVVSATNQIGVIESLDRIEALLGEGCNKEALEMVRIEQASALSVLRHEATLTQMALQRAKERNAKVVDRAINSNSPSITYLPSCK